MANQDKNQNEGTQGSDISQAQSNQQPTGQQQGQSSTGQSGSPESSQDSSKGGQSGQAGFGEAGSDTSTLQQTDTEGSSMNEAGQGGGQTGGQSGSFVGSEGRTDTSSELVEDQEFKKDGQGSSDENI